MTGRLNILHLFSDSMNLYGDRGNVLVLAQRARWRGINTTVISHEMGQPIDWAVIDLVFMGGGEDTHQSRIAEDFLAMGVELCTRLKDGLPMLAICGAYQLLGNYYKTQDGKELPGLGFFDVWTEPGKNRAIGDVVTETTLALTPSTLVGFENHSGRTYLGEGAIPLGKVIRGQGNNGVDGTEGAMQVRVLGSYLHGSLLPKNPHLADLLVSWALDWQGVSIPLSPLGGDEEMAAHQTILARVRK